ncbi:MalY/PatB family protein [Brevibacterium paucivorans]
MSYDDITIDSLIEKGSFKWSAYPGTIGAWTAEMDFGVAPAIRATLEQLDASDLYGYSTPALIRDMAQATAQFYNDTYGWDVNPEWVSPVSDVLTGMQAVLSFYTEPGAKLVLPTPAYMPFLTMPKIHGREIVEVPMLRNEFGSGDAKPTWTMDFEAIDRALSTAGADGGSGGLLVLCNPHNPIGRVYTRGELEELSRIVEKHGARVFSDEIHAPLTFTGHTHVPYASVNDVAANHTVTVTSHSKSFNTPGLKCAQIIFSNEADFAIWGTHGMFTGKSAANPGLLAAVAAYRDSRDWLADTSAYLERNRDALPGLLERHLPQAVYEPPEGTYLAWIDLSAYDLGDDLTSFFVDRARASIIDGALCGEAGRGFIRLNMGTPLPILEEIVERLGAAVAGKPVAPVGSGAESANSSEVTQAERVSAEEGSA